MKKFNQSNTDRGFVGIIVLVVVALVLLKYFFDFSIFEFLKSEAGREVVAYVKKILIYIKEFVLKIWDYIQ